MTNIVPVKAFIDNYIWIIRNNTEHSVWVVDPGDAKPVTAYLHENKLVLKGILITHHHSDHSGGIADLLDEWGGVPVYGFIESRVPYISHFVKEGDEVNCGSLTLKVIEIPGHTLDHIAYYNNEIIFCGDTLFSAGCGRVFEGTYEQMYHSLSKLLQMNDAQHIYCGHEYTLQNLRFAEQVEPENLFIQNKIKKVNQLLTENKPTLPSLLRDEKNMNPFFRCQESSVIQAAEQYAKISLSQPEEVFRALREWKNHF